MKKSNKLVLIKDICFDILIGLIGCFGVIFTVLYIETFEHGFCYLYSDIIICVSVSLISILTVLTIVFLSYSKVFVYKLFFLVITFILVITAGLYFLKITGILDKIDSIEKLRLYIASFGNLAVILFVIIQFLQVVVLPIPAFITVGAGVLLFGPFYGAIFSCVGIILGSIVAFYIGKIFGYRVAKWLVGKESLDKGLKLIKGKDKIILTFMFLFPFFPDDILCFVAGITTMSPTFFIIMIFITRIISVFASSYSMNNSIIPYDTWWGLLIWAIFIALTLFFMFFIVKKGDKIEKMIFKKKNKRK